MPSWGKGRNWEAFQAVRPRRLGRQMSRGLGDSSCLPLQGRTSLLLSGQKGVTEGFEQGLEN